MKHSKSVDKKTGLYDPSECEMCLPLNESVKAKSEKGKKMLRKFAFQIKEVVKQRNTNAKHIFASDALLKKSTLMDSLGRRSKCGPPRES